MISAAALRHCLRAAASGAGRFSASVQQHHHQFGAVTEDDRHELLFGELSLRGAGSGRHTWVAGTGSRAGRISAPRRAALRL